MAGTKETSVFRDVVDLAGVSLGIYFSFIIYGLVQEKIYKGQFGGETFTFTLYLVCCQCACNGLVAQCIVWFQGKPADKTPLSMYYKISFSYIGAMFCSNAALAYVAYPTQALAKSCKIIPVMLMRIVINGKRYRLGEYAAMACVTAGISVFMLSSGKAKSGGSPDSPIGLILLFCSLALDGYTGPTQENIIRDYSPNQYQMMRSMNFAAVSLVSVVLLVNGDLIAGTGFVLRHLDILPLLLLFGFLSASGQIFILMALFRFNSLVLTTITTTRKFFTILASVLWFGHILNFKQWGGVATVFMGLGLDAKLKYDAKKQRAKVSDGEIQKAK